MPTTDGAKPGGLRSRRRAQLVADVRRIALRQFDEYGYEGTSLRAICDEAGISLRTLFRHFKNKDEILTWRLADWSASILTQFVQQPKDVPIVQAYRAALADVVEKEAAADRDGVRSLLRLFDEVPSIRGHYLGSVSGHEDDGMNTEIAHRLGVEVADPLVRLTRSFISVAVAQAMADWANRTVPGELGALLDAYLAPIGHMVVQSVGAPSRKATARKTH